MKMPGIWQMSAILYGQGFKNIPNFCRLFEKPYRKEISSRLFYVSLTEFPGGARVFMVTISSWCITTGVSRATSRDTQDSQR